ncbi:MAG TPA: SDR family oxidoreductase [Thermoanaerobaculia bacterium]|nr:SDR family oxidoreductase [Thermoanaerobaculia bacterium]
MNRRDTATLLTLGAAALSARALLRRLRQESIAREVAIVTGASRGLGLAIARELARHECRLVICARDERELRKAAEELARSGASAVMPVVCDVANRDQVNHLVETAVQYFGRVDILVNNAGIIEVGPADAMRIDDYRALMDVMYWGVVNTTLAVLPVMERQHHGRIVNITSIGGKVSVPHLLPYSGAKFAAVGFSEGLHAEVARHGISVTTVVPGLMRTGSYRHAFFKGDVEREFAWFSVASTMPGLTVSCTRAARKVVSAMRRRAAEAVIGVPAKIAMRGNALMPGTSAAILALIARLLPHDATPRIASGFEAERRATIGA